MNKPIIVKTNLYNYKRKARNFNSAMSMTNFFNPLCLKPNRIQNKTGCKSFVNVVDLNKTTNINVLKKIEYLRKLNKSQVRFVGSSQVITNSIIVT